MNTAVRFASASCLKAGLPTIALLALCMLASAAEAAPTSETAPIARTARVSLSGLDLSTPDGVRAARERLRGTARRLCAQVEDGLDLSHQFNYVACVDETSAAALRQASKVSASTAVAGASTAVAKAARIGAPSLTQAYQKSP